MTDSSHDRLAKLGRALFAVAVIAFGVQTVVLDDFVKRQLNDTAYISRSVPSICHGCWHCCAGLFAFRLRRVRCFATRMVFAHHSL